MSQHFSFSFCGFLVAVAAAAADLFFFVVLKMRSGSCRCHVWWQSYFIFHINAAPLLDAASTIRLYCSVCSESPSSFIAVMRVNITQYTAAAYGREIRMSSSFDGYSRGRFTIWLLFSLALGLWNTRERPILWCLTNRPLSRSLF